MPKDELEFAFAAFELIKFPEHLLKNVAFSWRRRIKRFMFKVSDSLGSSIMNTNESDHGIGNQSVNGSLSTHGESNDSQNVDKTKFCL